MSLAASSAAAPPRGLSRLDVRTWHAGWGLGAAGLAALSLLLASEPPAGPELGALALLASPGALALLPPRALARASGWTLLAWAAASLAGLALGGGVTGALGAAALGPALAGLALGAWGRGLAASCLVAAALSVAEALGRVPLLPLVRGDAAALASGVVAGVAAAATAAGVLALRRGEVSRTPIAAEPPPGVEDAPLRAELAEAQAGRARAEGEARARARFLAEMSHELRTPLNAIVGFSDIMRTQMFGPLPARYAEYAELIHSSGDQLTGLINDVLDLSKIDAERYELRRERVDAREPVEMALRMMRGQAEAQGVTLVAALPDAAAVADADPRALRQIALNLLSNAIKFTPRGGCVTTTLTVADLDLELTVADTGVGVSPEDLQRLGRPYEQAEAGREAAQGTGLGLSLVRAFAGLHGGSLILESRLGEGTAATIRLPARREPELAAAAE